MASTKWGYLLLPGIKNWAVNEYPHFIDKVVMEENFSGDSAYYSFHDYKSDLWHTIEINNEIFYDSPEPYAVIVAIIKGKFAELLGPGLKTLMHSKHYGMSKEKLKDVLGDFGVANPNDFIGPGQEWSVERINNLLHNFLGSTLKLLHVFPAVDVFRIVLEIVPVSIHGPKGNTWVFKKTWLEEFGEEGFLQRIKTGLGIGKNVNGFIAKKKQIGFYEYVDLISHPSVIPYTPYTDRQGQFYEEDGKWIPVGLTLADVT